MNQNKYISLKELEQIRIKYVSLFKEYKKLKFIFSFKKRKFIKMYKNLPKLIEKNNTKFIDLEMQKTKYILDNINGYCLDLEQKKAILSDEDALLIVAGAGSGKTLTMIGKIRYLVEAKKIKPSEILCLSFTNFASTSLKNNMMKQTNYNVDIFTFHKLSLEIIKKKGLNINISKENLLSDIIDDYFDKELLNDKILLKNFFNNYILFHIKLDDANIKTNEEIIISNYLYFNNIKYEYKKIGIYKNKIIYAFYLIDYNLYIKYYTFNDDENNLSLYDNLKEVEIVRKYFKVNTLELFFNHFKENMLFDELNAFFIKNKVNINPKKLEEVYKIFLLKRDSNLHNLIITFINLFKSNNYSYQKFDDIENKIKNRKNLLIIFQIIKQIYNNYQIYLTQNNQIDFNDMITMATNMIEKDDVILKYKYIIIDEYQDTSYTRYKLIKTIKEKGDSKLIAVGDDFQSIYRFTGCDINSFLNFKEYFKYSKILYLTNTYRNSKELIKVAGDFIMKNKFQIKKKLNSYKTLFKPVKIYFYKNKKEISNLFSRIEEKEIFVLGRNNRDINYFEEDFVIDKNKIKYLEDKSKKITFMSIHKSKGLESESVVIVNLEDKKLGFPSQLEEDVLIHYLTNIKETFPFDEERRLFYVALTRTKNNVYLFVPYKNKSIFVTEIIKENRNLIEFIN